MLAESSLELHEQSNDLQSEVAGGLSLSYQV